jgi:RNA polymerase sigma factor (sigma-70 family)
MILESQQDAATLEDLAAQYQASRSDRDFEVILERCRGLVHVVARRVSRRWPGVRVADGDAEAAAIVGLWFAALRYLPGGEASFLTFAFSCMRGQVNRTFERQARAARMASLHATADEDGTPLVDLLADEHAEAPETGPARRDLAKHLWRLVEVHCTHGEGQAIRLHFGEGQTLAAIGGQIGRSGERVRQIIAEGCGRLAKVIGDPATLQAPIEPDPLAWDHNPVWNIAAVHDLERYGRLDPQLEGILRSEVKRRTAAGEAPPAVAPIPALLEDRRRRGVGRKPPARRRTAGLPPGSAPPAATGPDL